MSFKFSYLTILLLFFSSKLLAERHLIIMGGGGEPQENAFTIFDPMINNLSDYLKNNKWDTHIIFNGGHSDTEKILNEKYKDASKVASFNSKAFNEQLDEYEQKIKSGYIASGEQVLVIIDSHGVSKQEGDLTHQVVASNGAQDGLVSLDRLKKLSELALRKNIKLALIDFSCQSGATLALSNKNTCVISATGPNHLAFDTFSIYFSKMMNQGKDLESLFLETRMHDLNQSLPMISTPEGQSLTNDFYPLISPYFFKYNQNYELDTLTHYLLEVSNSDGICERNRQYDKLIIKLSYIRDFSLQQLKLVIPEIDEIAALITSYKKIQDQLISYVRSSDLLELNKKEEFLVESKENNYIYSYSINYTIAELLEIDFAPLLSNISTELARTEDKEKKRELQSSLELYNKARLKQEEIIQTHPQLIGHQNNFIEQMRTLDESSEIVKKITQKERALYEHIYRNLEQKNSQDRNPCKDFIL